MMMMMMMYFKYLTDGMTGGFSDYVWVPGAQPRVERVEMC